MIRKASVSIALLLFLLSLSCAAQDKPRTTQRKIVLWVWDRADDLRFLSPGEAEVALLMETIYLRDGQATSWWRRLPVHLPEGVKPIVAVRLESNGTALPPASEVARRFVRWRNMPGIQIDFDARASQIAWYGELIQQLKRDGPVSITALASWCLKPPWFASLAPEPVPMLYQMGPQRNAVLDNLRRRGQFAEACRESVGISTAEPLPWIPEVKRVWIFNPRPWTREAFDEARARLR